MWDWTTCAQNISTKFPTILSSAKTLNKAAKKNWTLPEIQEQRGESPKILQWKVPNFLFKLEQVLLPFWLISEASAARTGSMHGWTFIWILSWKTDMLIFEGDICKYLCWRRYPLIYQEKSKGLVWCHISIHSVTLTYSRILCAVEREAILIPEFAIDMNQNMFI